MADDLAESDWKVFRELRERALDRFCRRAVDEIERICTDGSQTHHARYLSVYRLVQERDEVLAAAFNDPRRSQMLLQLAIMNAQGLLEPPEIDRFSPRIRESIEVLAQGDLRGRRPTKHCS